MKIPPRPELTLCEGSVALANGLAFARRQADGTVIGIYPKKAAEKSLADSVKQFARRGAMIRADLVPLNGDPSMEAVDVRGRFVWHELMTRDVPGAKKFYSKLVGWKTQALATRSHLHGLPRGDGSGGGHHGDSRRSAGRNAGALGAVHRHA